MYAILQRTDDFNHILAKLDTAGDVQNQLSHWYDSVEDAMGEEAAEGLLEDLIVVTLQ